MNPKYFMALRRDPAKKYFLVSLRISNQVGAISQVSRVLAVRELNILESYSCVMENKSKAIWSFVVEPLNPRVDRKFLEDLLKTEKLVEKAEIAESEHGLMIDSLNFPVVWGGDARCVVLGSDFLRETREVGGAEPMQDWKDTVYELGFNYGRARYSAIFHDISGDPRSLIAYASKLTAATGMGRARVLDQDPSSSSLFIEVLESFECEGRRAGWPSSNFLRGIFAGASTAAFKTDHDCVESECIAKGDRRCLFELKPKTS